MIITAIDIVFINNSSVDINSDNGDGNGRDDYRTLELVVTVQIT